MVFTGVLAFNGPRHLRVCRGRQEESVKGCKDEEMDTEIGKWGGRTCRDGRQGWWVEGLGVCVVA